METFDLNFDNMGKPILHVHTPADKASVTFVFQDGMRRSFGVACNGDRSKASVKKLTLPDGIEGATIKTNDFNGVIKVGVMEVKANVPGKKDSNLVRFPTDRGNIDIEYDCEDSMAGHLVELPE